MIGRRLGAMVLGILAPLVVAVALYLIWLGVGTWTGVAKSGGTVSGLAGLGAPVTIVRDERGIPHIRAASVRDAFFAQGYAVGSDRLFQIDITRRYVLGRLSEVLGSSTSAVDRQERIVDIGGVADAAYARMGAQERSLLQAFADGINAAATHEALPPEYRALFAGFTPWRPQDALAVGFATALDLTDSYADVIARDTVSRAAGPAADARWYSLTDPVFDVPTTGGKSIHLAPLPPFRTAAAAGPAAFVDAKPEFGSNAFAVGAERSATGHALLASDPHLRRSVPGLWYLIDVSAPGFHVAGATLAGVPGVILGHNAKVAWGATNAYGAATRVYTEHFTTAKGAAYRAGSATLTATGRTETFHVRFKGDETQRYLITRHGFVVEETGVVRHAVQWDLTDRPRSPLDAFLALDRSNSIEDAMRALAAYPGPSQNFVLADVSGRAAYTVAGVVPSDTAWGLHAFDGQTASKLPLDAVPFDRLPHVAAARDASIVSANNLPYDAEYPLRLGASFAPPYRAAEIRRRLAQPGPATVAAFRAIQADTMSLAEAEFARMCVAALRRSGASTEPDIAPAFAALAAFDGKFDSTSHGATAEQIVRNVTIADLIALHLPAAAALAYQQNGPAFVTLMRALRERPRGWFPHDDRDAFLVAEVRSAVKRVGKDAIAQEYGTAYPVVAQHPLSGFGFFIWNGPRLAGAGGSYSPAVQGPVLGQSFRAVWNVGAWDDGGIDIPLGESGEPASPHYTDLAARWPQHVLTPLPFSPDAVARAARSTLVLAP